ESTGLAVRLLDPKEGMRVLDLCAAPGGKSSYIADLMGNNGEIIALDKFESRLKLVAQNLERLDVSIVKTVHSDGLEYEAEPFDRVIADVPCSGLGTLSKKPDIKWKKELLDVRQLNELQYQLLKKGASLLKPGGILVYSTCTIEPEENWLVVERFLMDNDEFELQHAAEFLPVELTDMNGCVQTLPHKHKMDGAFAARIRRKS
ncbi:partial cobalt-precorrin-6B (C15)-methyltransferase, partial [Anaerolineae bacterium]